MPRWLKAILIAAMFLYGILAVSVVLPGADFFLGRRANSVREAICLGWNQTVCRILGLRLHIKGIPSPTAGMLVANHISWLDIIAFASQRPFTFVAKREVASWPIMGYLARRVGTLFVRRGDSAEAAEVAEQMTWQFRQGKRLMLFPEGTTTCGDRVLRFHSRLFQPAQLAHAEVQAVAIAYEGEARELAPFVGEDEFLPHLLRILKLRTIEITLYYCDPLPAGIHRENLAQTSRQQVVTALSRNSDYFGLASSSSNGH